jgi:quinolinate synthase
MRDVRSLLKERKGILLAHNYQRPEIQDCADLCGDSLELSIKAASTDAEVIVFCGVHFMAETASILCPEKKVLLPVLGAGCPMADTISAAQLRDLKKKNPGAVVVSYVNTTAEVKAESDICCTSANAVQVVESFGRETPVLMIPDRNLAQYTAKRTGRDISYWNGFCPIHESLTPQRVLEAKREHPSALFVAHPECRPEVLDLADEIKSTSGMIALARESDLQEFIIATEVGILYPLALAAPGKRFYPADPAMVCPDMKKITLEDVLETLKRMGPEVKVPPETGRMAMAAVRRMLALSGKIAAGLTGEEQA